MTYTVKAYYKHGHGAEPVIVTTPEEMDVLVDAILAEEFGNSVAALYVAERPRTERGHPDHELRVAINSEAKVGSLRYAGKHARAAGVWYATGQQSQRKEVFYYYMGHDEGYPQDSELPIDDIRTAVKEFLESGGERPAAAQWRGWPEGVG